ncbi:MAG TPA: four helix bundle protein [Ohtaekwangia sp.]
MDIEDLKIYGLSMKIGDEIWTIVANWNNFVKDTIGKQLVRSADSIAANISEGYGRYHYKDSRNFGYYSRGSLYETKTWLTKAHQRKLVNDQDFNNLSEQLGILSRMLNSYIKSIGNVNEPSENYGTDLPMTSD